MRRQSRILHKAMLGILVLVAAGMTHAQNQGQILKVNVPFNFSIGTQSFSPGEYTLNPVFQHKMVLKNQSGQVLSYIGTNSVESTEVSSSTKLIFHRYGEQYFLSQIWEPGNSIGEQLSKSRTEIETAKAQNSRGQQVALNFNPQH